MATAKSTKWRGMKIKKTKDIEDIRVVQDEKGKKYTKKGFK